MENVTETLKEPVVTFVLLLAVILAVPPLFERIRLPGLVGLLVAGVVLGTNGLNWLSTESETMSLFSDIGKIYLMFVAGLEIDLDQFRRTRNRSLGFGLATFGFPLTMGILLGRLFDFDWNASVLIGSLLASHTLLAYPIVRRLGVVSDEAVTVTIGATIFTDISALLVLAVCVGINQGDFSAFSLGLLLVSLGIYAVGVLFGLDRLGKSFFRRTKHDQGNQFLFVLLSVFVASVAAQLIGVEQIVGAFLAGLAVNDVLGDSPVKEKVEFIGSVLFIPIFFVDMGLLLDLQAFVQTLDTLGLAVAIVGGLLLSKFLAALAIKLIYRYNWPQTLTMWSLSVPQVAATLAATVVGYQEGILNEAVFNSVILMMLVTAVIGPLVTTRAAAKLSSRVLDELPSEEALEAGSGRTRAQEETVVVPVYNPQTERFLLELAAVLARSLEGRIVPLAIAKAQERMDAPEMNRAIDRCRDLLAQAQEISNELAVVATPQLRIAGNVAEAINYTSREEEASLIVLGMGRYVDLRARLFGNITDRVLRSAHCPVAIARLLGSPLDLKRILVPVETVEVARRQLDFAQRLAQENGGQVTLLNVCHPKTSKPAQALLYEQLLALTGQISVPVPTNVQVVPQEDVISSIVRISGDYDLVIVRSQRLRIGADGLALGSFTKPLLERLPCSVILLGDPQE